MSNAASIEKVARIVARAHGHDPDCLVSPAQPYLIGTRQFVMVADWNKPFPIWHWFKGQVEAILEGMKK